MKNQLQVSSVLILIRWMYASRNESEDILSGMIQRRPYSCYSVESGKEIIKRIDAIACEGRTQA
ncbi:MAG: hypothetical protein APR53_02920 [Methanoculleus sp. SDB]|nr:MAG: hypothetical protein APR53_02920 [Methanoculleus sp. SDB]